MTEPQTEPTKEIERSYVKAVLQRKNKTFQSEEDEAFLIVENEEGKETQRTGHSLVVYNVSDVDRLIAEKEKQLLASQESKKKLIEEIEKKIIKLKGKSVLKFGIYNMEAGAYQDCIDLLRSELATEKRER